MSDDPSPDTWLPATSAIQSAAPEPDFGWNDTGNADRLAAGFGQDLMYCRERKSYYVWTGARWEFDEFLEAERRAELTVRGAFAQAGAIDDEKRRMAYIRFLNKSLSRNGLANMAHLAKKKVRVISATELDRDPWLLNVQNGTLDLRTGTLQPHQRTDLLSKLIPVSFDAVARCPLFIAFLNRIAGAGPAAETEQQERADRLVRYLQRLFGCAATGKPEKMLAVLYGHGGNNGKTTLLTTISKALGDREYATQINIDSLMADPKGMGSSNAVTSDLSDLQGARYVFTSEVDKSQRLSLGRVKYLTGLSAIRARRMRENWITFQPTHKIFMDCNDRPAISSPTDAVWNRVFCIPFDVVIPDDEIDTDLPIKLEAELPGILCWIAAGAREYFRDGLTGRPDEVQASTEDYRQSSDRLKEFLEDRCHCNPHAWVTSERLVAAYVNWCRKNGERYPLEGREFTDQIRAKGCSPKSREVQRKPTRGWLGIDLRETSEAVDE